MSKYRYKLSIVDEAFESSPKTLLDVETVHFAIIQGLVDGWVEVEDRE